MIQKECFTKEWIEQVKENLNYSDVNLIKKVIRAFSLVEMLTLSGCPYIWKGLCVATHKPFAYIKIIA